ncbi:HAD-IIIC family phosphatase [Luteibaculum oceani]|uniref:HAD-IIIC family phosphatase n=1 Tax=Luteibaculum oceani TaxID=1294296 RepID=A0A5C6VAR4_9FLAO|nr:HAD-IIIC family phosphatase [Luteibaculum oceani]TXC81940.1 HAD-IIIC family phosphatase [Luteibaculum oceani]
MKTPSSSTKKPVIKCVVWDLDNTLWNGVLLEHDELQLRDGIKEIIQTLDQWGIINSISSKNNFDDAKAKLESYGLWEYFLYPQISWDLKSNAISTIQEKLNIGFDAIAFIDDQAFEREEVNFVHHKVHCYDIDIIPQILHQFKPRFITPESSLRRKMYLDDEVRNNEEKEIGNNQAFLKSLDLDFRITRATVDDLQRVEELTIRTNQLNATGYSYSYDELETLIHSPNHMLLVAELTDRYGSYGKIGVAMAEFNQGIWNLKLLLMSCRVMSRGVGGVLLSYIMHKAKSQNTRLQAEFLPTDRNRLMYVTYKFSGFTEAGKLENGGVVLEHNLEKIPAYPEYIKVQTPDLQATS